MVFFFKTDLEYSMHLAPQYFGPRMRNYVRDEIVKAVEGKCLGRDGYVIAVMELRNEDIDTGVVEYDSGMVSINARYSAILVRPFKNEVLDAIVTQVNEIGFFTEAGPLTIFVSRHAMPHDLQDGYDADAESWTSEDKEVEIKQKCVVRIKLLGVTCDTNEISSVGTIKDDYLGLVSMGTNNASSATTTFSY